MKHINKFNEMLEIGDYILVDITDQDKEYQRFININIGRIKEIYNFKDNPNNSFATVEYRKIPKILLAAEWKPERKYHFRGKLKSINNTEIPIKDIKFYSKNKEEIEEILTAKKYNL